MWNAPVKGTWLYHVWNVIVFLFWVCVCVYKYSSYNYHYIDVSQNGELTECQQIYLQTFMIKKHCIKI